MGWGGGLPVLAKGRVFLEGGSIHPKSQKHWCCDRGRQLEPTMWFKPPANRNDPTF